MAKLKEVALRAELGLVLVGLLCCTEHNCIVGMISRLRCAPLCGCLVLRYGQQNGDATPTKCTMAHKTKWAPSPFWRRLDDMHSL